MASMERMKQYKEDDVILREGEKTDILYKMISGKAAVYLNYGTKDEYIVGILSEQSYFGELSFLLEQSETYTVVAVSDALIMHITREEFEEYVRRNAGNAITLMKALAKKVGMMQRHIGLAIEELASLEQAGESTPEKIDLKKN